MRTVTKVRLIGLLIIAIAISLGVYNLAYFLGLIFLSLVVLMFFLLTELIAESIDHGKKDL